MAIKPICDKYKEELTEAGGLVFSPPIGDDNKVRVKYHLCVKAWTGFVEWHKVTCLHIINPDVYARNVAIAFSPPGDLTSAEPIKFYYINKGLDWDLFLEWLHKS